MSNTHTLQLSPQQFLFKNETPNNKKKQFLNGEWKKCSLLQTKNNCINL